MNKTNKPENMEKLNRIIISQKHECCGCYACYNKCPSQAISMKYDDEGFNYPSVNTSKCLNCGLCKKVCPLKNRHTTKELCSVYAAKSLIEEDLLNSSSGAISHLIARNIIQNGGIVYGAVYNDNWLVEHRKISDIKDLEYIRGSKYSQSSIDYIFRDIENELKAGKEVLFTGTSCQVQGLTVFLGKDYSNLYTIDLVCHGVASPLVWKDYVCETIGNYKLIDFKQRNKENGIENAPLVFTLENGRKIIEPYNDSAFQMGYLLNLFLRPSCYNCAFKGLNRPADLTLGDYWGIEEIHPEIDKNKGVSLIMVHSRKGIGLIDRIQKNIELMESFEEGIVKKNPAILYSANYEFYDRDYFFRQWKKKGVQKAVQDVKKPSFLERVRRKL